MDNTEINNKAKELVDKYKPFFYFFNDNVISTKHSKNAAIREVEEILKIDWQKVKEAIKKL